MFRNRFERLSRFFSFSKNKPTDISHYLAERHDSIFCFVISLLMGVAVLVLFHACGFRIYQTEHSSFAQPNRWFDLDSLIEKYFVIPICIFLYWFMVPQIIPLYEQVYLSCIFVSLYFIFCRDLDHSVELLVCTMFCLHNKEDAMTEPDIDYPPSFLVIRRIFVMALFTLPLMFQNGFINYMYFMVFICNFFDRVSDFALFKKFFNVTKYKSKKSKISKQKVSNKT